MKRPRPLLSKLRWLVPALYIVFLLLPIYWLVSMSFKTTNEILGAFTLWPSRFTLENYAKIFDLYHLRLFGRTLRLGLITTVICVVLGYPLAYWLARARPRLQTLGLFLLIMPLMVSAVIRVFGWIVILGRKGLVNQVLLALGLDPVKLLYTETAVVIGLVNIFMPFMVLPLMAAIERIPRNLEEAARNLGANAWQTFRRTILPLSLPGLISGCLLVYAESISAFVTPALMGSSRERMVGQPLPLQESYSESDPAPAAALTPDPAPSGAR